MSKKTVGKPAKVVEPIKRDCFERARDAREYFQRFIDKTKNLDPKDFHFRKK